MDNKDYVKEYDEKKFIKKLLKVAKKLGAKIVYYFLILYYTLQDPSVPAKYKVTIAGALGYFILPIDLIPDMAPAAGHVDDISVLISTLMSVMLYINPAIKEKAKNKLKDMFGEDIEDEVKTFDAELEKKNN